VRNFVIGLLAAGLWLAVVVSLALVRRAAPGHPFRSIRLFRRSNRALASSADGAPDYEPPLFGSGPWPMESPLDRPEPEPSAAPTPRTALTAEPEALRAPAEPSATGPDEDFEHEGDFTVIETRRRRRKTTNPEPDGEPTEMVAAAEGPGELTGEIPPVAEAPAEPQPQPAGLHAATEWGPPRRGLFRRRKEQPDLLSPAFARVTEEPKLVTRLENPQEEQPREPAPPEAAETEPASPAGPRRRPRRKARPVVDITDEAMAARSRFRGPRIITLVDDDEPEEEQPREAPVWVQRVVQPTVVEPEIVLVPDEPHEVSVEDDDGGPLVHALRRAAEMPSEGPPPERPAPAVQPPPGSMPVPLPFIRGIGRTRNRLVTRAGAPPPIVHIQTITLGDDGEPLVVTADEPPGTPEAARLSTPEVEEPAGGVVDVDVPPTDRVDAPTEAWEPEPPAELWEPEAPAEAREPEPPAALWEPEPPAEAPWAEAATIPVEPEPAPQEEAEPAPAAPAAASADRIDDEAEIVILPAAPKQPEQEPEPGAEPPAAAARRVSRPAPIGARPRRMAASGAGSRRPERSAVSRPESDQEEALGTVIPLTTGRAVRPRVTVNLTPEDIEDSDELYEVEALLDAVTRDRRKKAAPPSPPKSTPPPTSETRPPGGEAPADADAVRPRVARAQRPESRPIVRRPASAGDRAAAPKRPTAPTGGVQPAYRAPSEESARLQERPAPWSGSRTEARRAGTAPNGARRPDRRREANGRPADTATQQKATATRRKAARPVTLILVDEEGRPQPD
jgi:hypothetical protein